MFILRLIHNLIDVSWVEKFTRPMLNSGLSGWNKISVLSKDRPQDFVLEVYNIFG